MSASQRGGGFTCPKCQRKWKATGDVVPGFSDWQDVDCPDDGTTMGEIRCDVGYPTVEPWDGEEPIAVMTFSTGSPDQCTMCDGEGRIYKQHDRSLPWLECRYCGGTGRTGRGR